MIFDVLPVNNYCGDNFCTKFDFDFLIEDSSQLDVYLVDKFSAKTKLKFGLDYSIAEMGNINGSYIVFPVEGSVYSVLSPDEKISLELSLPILQQTQYNNSTSLNMKSLEYSFDYLTRLIQIISRKFELCVKVQEGTGVIPEEIINQISQNAKTAKEVQEKISEIIINSNNLLDNASDTAKLADNTLLRVENLSETVINHVSFNLFDTKISDHILEGVEAKGWALQGTYVSKSLYPDFYNACLVQKQTATEKEITLADSTLTMFVNSNGHQFFNISDKQIVDDFYDAFGIADFYGIDEENERIFLPRNKYFQQLTVDVSNVNKMMEAGLPNIEGGPTGAWRANLNNTFSGASYANNNVAIAGSGATSETVRGAAFDASLSNPIYGNSDTVQPPSSLKLLYYCVGNTLINESEIDAGALVSQMEHKANIFLDNVLPSSDFKNQITSYCCPDYQNGIVGASALGAEQTFVAPANGIISYSISAYNKGSAAYIKINDVQILWAVGNMNPDFNSLTGTAIVAKGDVIKYFSSYDVTTYNTQNIIFFPMKGAN